MQPSGEDKSLAGAEVDFLEAFATGQRLDAGNDLGAVHEQFVANNRVGDVDDEAALALDPHGVGVSGVGGPDEFGPVGADRMFDGIAANLMLGEDRFNETGERDGGALLGTPGFVEGDAAQLADEFLGEATEGVGLGFRGHEPRQAGRDGVGHGQNRFLGISGGWGLECSSVMGRDGVRGGAR